MVFCRSWQQLLYHLISLWQLRTITTGSNFVAQRSPTRARTQAQTLPQLLLIFARTLNQLVLNFVLTLIHLAVNGILTLTHLVVNFARTFTLPVVTVAVSKSDRKQHSTELQTRTDKFGYLQQLYKFLPLYQSLHCARSQL